jgi:hypothetical protein
MMTKTIERPSILLPTRVYLQAEHERDLAMQLDTQRIAIQDTMERRFDDVWWPFILASHALEHALARFDQCVIDRGPGMMEQLNRLQSHLYDKRSILLEKAAAFDRHYAETPFIMEVERVVLSRLQAFNRLFKEHDDTAYATLVDLAGEMAMAHPLIDLARDIDRGGRRGEASDVLDRIGEMLYQVIGPEKTALHSWAAAGHQTRLRMQAGGDAAAARRLDAERKYDFGGFCKKQYRRYQKKIGQ